MKISIRRKIILTFFVFMVIGAALWFLNYYNFHLLNRKLQILEKKANLLSTILEARRYEKNYFLSSESQYLHDALSYVRQGEQKLSNIIREYGRYTLARNLDQELKRLKEYKDSLASVLEHYDGGSLRVDKSLIGDLPGHQGEVRRLGKRITSDMEEMLTQERGYVNRLVNKSRSYHLVALAGIILLSVFTALFLVFNVNRPLKSIEGAILKIAQGDYKNIPALSTGDEFESLVTSLNSMIDELNRRSEQLIQTEKMASLGTLTSGVAHELNNPLNNISTSVQILLEELEEGAPEYQQELLRQTEGQVERARDIVKALLEFSRERSFSLKQVDFKDLVDDTIKLIKGELPADVELRVEVPEGIQAYIDQQRIEQVLLNLILNGVQAMEEGGVLKIMACKQEEKEEFCFKVQDTGEGIPEENLSKIFDPFFTSRDTKRDSKSGPPRYEGIVGQKGSGLGLSVSHGIVEKHGGRIEVESQVGKGTTFTVHLPLGRRDGTTV